MLFAFGHGFRGVYVGTAARYDEEVVGLVEVDEGLSKPH